MSAETMERSEHELRFQPLFDAGRALVFPCDAAGKVDMDRLGERALGNYLYARAMVGCEFHAPAVRRRTPRQQSEQLQQAQARLPGVADFDAGPVQRRSALESRSASGEAAHPARPSLRSLFEPESARSGWAAPQAWPSISESATVSGA